MGEAAWLTCWALLRGQRGEDRPHERGEVVGLASFGASAPSPVLMEKLGITPEDVVAAAKRIRA